MRASKLAGLLVAAAAVMLPSPASATERCSRVVVFTLPGVTWRDVERFEPPELVDAAELGAVGSMSVRTVSATTTYASGFATIGAGSRLDGGQTTGGPADVRSDGGVSGDARLANDVRVAGVDEMRALAETSGYGARPGALASALDEVRVTAVGNGDVGAPPPSPAGYDRWSLLAAMDSHGVVESAATGAQILARDDDAPFGLRTEARAFEHAIDRALERRCGVVIADPGDLTRAERLEVMSGGPLAARGDALRAASALLGHVMRALDEERDLLLVVSPTSPDWDDDVHFGIALAVGPGFERGHTLASASTRRTGMVTLPDVAPTVLAHLGVERPAVMLGRPWFSVAGGSGDPVDAAISLDEESVFIDRLRTPIATGFVVFQVVSYGVIISMLVFHAGRDRRLAGGLLGMVLELAALAVVAFPVSTYLVGVLTAHALGTAGFVAVLLATDAALLVAVSLSLRRPLDRLLALTALTTIVLIVDLVVGGPLQLNTVFSYSPIVAGRFAGIGNLGFSVLAAATLVTGTLIVHRWAGVKAALAAAGALFVVTVIVDGAPQFGSDVGGVIALVPGLGVTWVLLSGRRPGWKLLVASIVAAIACLGIFLAVDLARPPEARTHLGRLFEDVQARGADVFVDTVARKARTNVRVFRSTIWTYLVPPAVALVAWLSLRPPGRWQRLAETYPRLRAGLIGGIVVGALGFAVNDSGIVIPAVVLSFLVPMALLMHVAVEREGAATPAP